MIWVADYAGYVPGAVEEERGQESGDPAVSAEEEHAGIRHGWFGGWRLAK